jgi:hypothetical protein
VPVFVLPEYYAYFDPFISRRRLRELGLDREEGYVGRGTSVKAEGKIVKRQCRCPV